MKYTLSILLLLCTVAAYSQQAVITPSLKFGKPSSEELSLTTYAQDTTAAALVLYRTGETKYTYRDNDFNLETEICVKIKILKSAGVRFADITLPYYAPEKALEKRDNILEPEAYSYNLENKKTVRTVTEKQFIVRERLNDKYMQLKMSIPNVRVGSVIEYRYKQSSEFYHHLENWEMQDEIPVLFSEYIVNIPRTFDFNAEIRGKNYVNVKTKEGSINISVRDDNTGIAQVQRNLFINTLHITCTSHRLPALRQDEKFLWCPDDHKIQVSFELKGTQYPGSPYKPYTQAWSDIDAVLLKDESFGQNLNLPNPYREEMKNMQVMLLNKEERIGCLMKLLRQKMAWNGQYGLYSRDLTKTINKGSGSSADLNFILMSMMREAGLKVYPVVLSRRNMGVLPFTYPSIQKLNAFIIGVETDDNKLNFVDSSMDSSGYLNVLPVNMMVSKARIISPESMEKWADLTKLCTSIISVNIEGAIQPDATISGTCKAEYSGQAAAQFRRDYFSTKDSTANVEKRCDDENWQITGYQTKNVREFADKLEETITFSKPSGNATDEFLYVNPLVVLHTSKNPFTQADRQLPVELPYPYSMRILSSLTIPEGYTVEELPKPGLIKLEEKDITCRYTIQASENKLTTTYTFALNKTEFSVEDYKHLQSVWEKIVQKNNEMAVLKKNK